MMTASSEDRTIVTDILVSSFEGNLSVNYLITQDKLKTKRMRCLMAYAFDTCFDFGKVFLSDNRKACALLLFPEQQKTGMKKIGRDIKLILYAIGIAKVFRAMTRESKIKKRHPTTPFAYLWFIGVYPGHQQNGIGTNLLKEVLTYCGQKKRSVYLETSTLKNVPWYKKMGFEQYDELNFGYTLYFFKRA